MTLYLKLLHGPQQQGDNINAEPRQSREEQESDNGWSAILNSNPELKAVVSACEKYIPFLIIILVKSVFEHGTGIIVCCGLVLTFLHANSVLKQQVSYCIVIEMRTLIITLLQSGCKTGQDKLWGAIGNIN